MLFVHTLKLIVSVTVKLEDSLQASAQDLKYASQTLQADLDRFQRQKVADLRDLAIHLAEIHRDWAKTVSIVVIVVEIYANGNGWR